MRVRYFKHHLVMMLAFSLIVIESRAAPKFKSSPWFAEEEATWDAGEGVRVSCNRQIPSHFTSDKPTRLVIYALPNGNRLEHTLGCQLSAGLDWRYDIQHVAAQIRCLRACRHSENIVLLAIEADRLSLSWPRWRAERPKANDTIRRLLANWISDLDPDKDRVTLVAHSGGGSFIWGVIEGGEAIPSPVDRIVWLDANYSYDQAIHREKLLRWLKQSHEHTLFVAAYDDREVMYRGKKVVGTDGGTYRATQRMIESTSVELSWTRRRRPPFEIAEALDRRFQVYVHNNPENKILHTALVGDMNGLLQSLTWLRNDCEWGTWGGPRAFSKWVQPAPSSCVTQPNDRERGLAIEPQKVDTLAAQEILTAKEIIAQCSNLTLEEREKLIVSQLLQGNMPQFLRKFVPVPMTLQGQDGKKHQAVLEVMPDYLAVGSDASFVRVPLTPQSAQLIADAWSCTLPTPELVDAIDQSAKVNIAPHPLTEAREAWETMVDHHTIIERQLSHLPKNSYRRGDLTIGGKKDVVLSPRIYEKPRRLAIYGWRRLNGKPIQPLTIVHWDRYVDYSHGIRLIRRRFRVDGFEEDLLRWIVTPELAKLLIDGKVCDPPRYPPLPDGSS